GVGGAHGDHVLVEAGAADGQAAVLAVVARGEHGDDPGGVPQVDDVGVERVVAAVAGPGVVDHVGGHRRVGVVARGVGGRGYPLPGGQEGLQGRRGARGGGDPFGAGGDADAVALAVVADHGAHGVGAVAVLVAGLAAAFAGGVEEVVVVGEGAVAVVAPVPVHERGVVVLHARIDGGDDDALAVDALGPQFGGADLFEVPRRVVLRRFGPLGPRGRGLALALGGDRRDVAVFGRFDDGLDLVESGELFEQSGVGDGPDRRRGPERLVFGARGFERFDHVGLAVFGVGVGGLDGGAALLLLLVGGERVAPVGGAGEPEPQLGLAGAVDLFEDFGFGLLFQECAGFGAGGLGPGACGGHGREERAREGGREDAAEPRRRGHEIS